MWNDNDRWIDDKDQAMLCVFAKLGHLHLLSNTRSTRKCPTSLVCQDARVSRRTRIGTSVGRQSRRTTSSVRVHQSASHPCAPPPPQPAGTQFTSLLVQKYKHWQTSSTSVWMTATRCCKVYLTDVLRVKILSLRFLFIATLDPWRGIQKYPKVVTPPSPIEPRTQPLKCHVSLKVTGVLPAETPQGGQIRVYTVWHPTLPGRHWNNKRRRERELCGQSEVVQQCLEG